MVKACRDAVGPDMILAVDVAYCWPDWKGALRAIEMFADADIYFVETPLPSDDIEGYAKLCAASPMRIAAGEWLNTRFECLEMMDRGGLDIIQPDVGRVGGLTRGAPGRRPGARSWRCGGTPLLEVGHRHRRIPAPRDRRRQLSFH